MQYLAISIHVEHNSCNTNEEFWSHLGEVENFFVQELYNILDLFNPEDYETFEKFCIEYRKEYGGGQPLFVKVYDLEERKEIKNKFTDLEYLFEKAKNKLNDDAWEWK